MSTKVAKMATVQMGLDFQATDDEKIVINEMKGIPRPVSTAAMEGFGENRASQSEWTDAWIGSYGAQAPDPDSEDLPDYWESGASEANFDDGEQTASVTDEAPASASYCDLTKEDATAVSMIEAIYECNKGAAPTARVSGLKISRGRNKDGSQKPDPVLAIVTAVRAYAQKLIEIETGKEESLRSGKVIDRASRIIEALEQKKVAAGDVAVIGEHLVVDSYNSSPTMIDTLWPNVSCRKLFRLSGTRVAPSSVVFEPQPKGPAKAHLGPVETMIGSGPQRTGSSVLKAAFNNMFAVLGGQGGFAKIAAMRPEKGADLEMGSYLKLLVDAFATGAAPAGYASKLNATLKMPAQQGLAIIYYQESENEAIRGSDGNSYGWNVNHPYWKEMLEKHGLSCLQYVCVDPRQSKDGRYYVAFAKGLLSPYFGKADGPAVRINVNCVKGVGKGRLLGGETASPDAWFGVHKVQSTLGTQQVGYQWLAHLASTPENVRLVSDRAAQAVNSLISDKSGKRLSPVEFRQRLISSVAKLDPDVRAIVEVIAAINKNRQGLVPYDPMNIPVVRAKVEAKLQKSLFQAFAGLGIEGRIKVLIMDDQVPQGKMVVVNARPTSYGRKAVVWRSPQQHHQGNMTLEVIPPSDRHIVMSREVELTEEEYEEAKKADPNAARVKTQHLYARNCVYMNPVDVAKINGDDDGDTVAVSYDRDLVKLVESHAKHFGRALWKFEPTSSAKGSRWEADRNGYYGELLMQDQGAVGLYCNAMMQANEIARLGKAVEVNVYDRSAKAEMLVRYDSLDMLPSVYSVLAQGAIDQLKKLVEVAPLEYLMDFKNWSKGSETDTLGQSYDTVTAPKPKGDVPAIPLATVGEEVGGLISTLNKGAYSRLWELAAKPTLGQLSVDKPEEAKPSVTDSKVMPLEAKLPGRDRVAALRQEAKAKANSPAPDNMGPKDEVDGKQAWRNTLTRIGAVSKAPGRVDPVSWKWHGTAMEGLKNRVDPRRWLLCGQKDGGWSWWLFANGVKTPSCIHAAHDAAAKAWNAAGMLDVIVGPETKEGEAPANGDSYLAFGRVFAEAYDRQYGAGAFAKGVSSCPRRTADVAEKDQTYLEREFEKVLGRLLSAIKAADATNKASAGDDDNGKALAEAQAKFRAWVIGEHQREEDGKPRALTALECIRLGFAHEMGYILNDDLKKSASYNRDGDKAREGRASQAYNLLFDGSPICAALGVKTQCRAGLGISVTTETLTCYNSTKEDPQGALWLKEHGIKSHKEALGNREYLKMLIEWIDAWHQEEGGCPLSYCRTCAGKVKMTIAEMANDPVPFVQMKAMLDSWRSRGDFSTPSIYGLVVEGGWKSTIYQVPVEDVRAALKMAGIKLSVVPSKKTLEKLSGTTVEEYSNYFLSINDENFAANATRPSALPDRVTKK